MKRRERGKEGETERERMNDSLIEEKKLKKIKTI